MKKHLFILLLLLITQLSYAVAIERLTATTVRFYNYSNSSFGMVGMHLTIGNTVYQVDNLNIKAGGPLNVAPGDRIEFDGLTLPAIASIALWYSNAFPSNQNAGNIASFMQYGAAGQPYEAIAVQAGLWATGEFVPGAPPLIRDGNYTSWGAANWSAGLSQFEVGYEPPVMLYPNPFANKLIVSNLGDHVVYAEMINGQGKTCIHTEGNGNNELEINTENLKNGIYLFRFQLSNGQVISRRVMKH